MSLNEQVFPRGIQKRVEKPLFGQSLVRVVSEDLPHPSIGVALLPEIIVLFLEADLGLALQVLRHLVPELIRVREFAVVLLVSEALVLEHHFDSFDFVLLLVVQDLLHILLQLGILLDHLEDESLLVVL